MPGRAGIGMLPLLPNDAGPAHFPNSDLTSVILPQNIRTPVVVEIGRTISGERLVTNAMTADAAKDHRWSAGHRHRRGKLSFAMGRYLVKRCTAAKPRPSP